VPRSSRAEATARIGVTDLDDAEPRLLTGREHLGAHHAEQQANLVGGRGPDPPHEIATARTTESGLHGDAGRAGHAQVEPPRGVLTERALAASEPRD